jgi:DNA-binding NarL/FixJ family response regulator
MTENKTHYSILLVDDHQMVIDGIKSMLLNQDEFTVLSEANNGQQAFDIIKSNPLKYDIVVADISMPLLSGVELCRMIKDSYPHIKVLILSMYNSGSAVKEAISAEADAYVLKDAGKDELLTALHKISKNGTYFAQDIIPIIYTQYNTDKEKDDKLSILTQREKQILNLILSEFTSEEIALELHISKKTVDNHRHKLLEKCACKSTVGLVKFAIKYGLKENV